MRVHLQAILLYLSLSMLYSLPQAAPAPPAAVPFEPIESESVNTYWGRLKDFYRGETAQEATQEVEKAVEKKTTSVAAPEGFGDRVNEAVSDFLPFFQFAVNSVSTSDDKKSVTVKLNTIRFGNAVVALSGTASEPEPFEELINAIAEPARQSESKAMLAGISDFSDLTVGAEIGYLSSPGDWTSKKLFGRDADIYQKLIGEYLDAAWDQIPSEVKREADRLIGGVDSRPLRALNQRAPLNVTFKQIRDAIAQNQLNNFDERAFWQALAEQARAEARLHLQFAAANASILPALVDNQPQLVLKVATRSRDDVLGPNSTVGTLSYEMGSDNFNALLKRYRAKRDGMSDSAAKVEALQDLLDEAGDEEKLIFSLSYKDVEDYHFTRQYKFRAFDAEHPEGFDIERTAQVDLGRAKEWRGKVAFTRFIRPRSAATLPTPLPSVNDPEFWDKAIPKEQRPRLTLSIEWADYKDNPTLHDQFIGKISYIMPMMGGATIPVTLVWANRPELVGQNDHIFGAHVGISYKLSRNVD